MTSSRPHGFSGSLTRPWMLRRVLAIGDVAAVAAAWTMVLAGAWLRDPETYRPPMLGVWLIVATGVTATVLSRAQLYLTRVLAIRAVEVQRIGRSCLIAAVVLATVDRMVGSPLGWTLIVTGALATYGLLVAGRGVFQMWLHEARRRGERGRSLLVVGDPEDAHRTLGLLADRPELGYRIVGYVSTRRSPVDIEMPWLGTPADLALLTQLTAVSGVLVVAGALEPEILHTTVSELRDLDVHVHLAVDDGEHRPDIRVLPLLHRTAPAVEQPALSSWQRTVKRAFDVVAGAALAVILAPAVAVAAGLLKVATGGPVLVRDTRLGPRGEQLEVTRLRTSHLPSTRLARFVGRLCRRLCIDELPQLGNVLAGSMSLVGPRPQRPGRAAESTTSDRPGADSAPTGMNAGLIGLRHVEARDYPQYGPYRRLDQFYAENWSIGLDVSILAASATHVLWRSARQTPRDDEHAVIG